MTGIFKKLIVLIGDFIVKVDTKYKIWKILSNQNISINVHAKINRSSIIEIKNGGKIQIGNSEILENVIIQTYGGDIVIGDHCSINASTIIYGHGGTKIGSNVLIAGGCMIIPANHMFQNINIPISKQGLSLGEIIINDDVWIGHGCTILSGVNIGSGSIIAAGSVVNKDVEPFSIYGGVPAKKLKDRIIS